MKDVNERIAEALERIADAMEKGAGPAVDFDKAKDLVDTATQPANVVELEPARKIKKVKLVEITKEDLKELLMEVNQHKGSTVGRQVLTDLGANTLSQLDKTLYGTVVERCKEILGE